MPLTKPLIKRYPRHPQSLDELGCFYPNLQSDATVVIGEEAYYCDVNEFIMRVHDVAIMQGEAVLQQNLVYSLRGIASAWYNQIDEATTLALWYSPLDQGWIKILRDRFQNRSEGTAFMF
jgi:hypothetical protein